SSLVTPSTSPQLSQMAVAVLCQWKEFLLRGGAGECTPSTYKKKLAIKWPQAGPSGGFQKKASLSQEVAAPCVLLGHDVEMEEGDMDNPAPVTNLLLCNCQSCAFQLR
ncbi:MTERF4 isoform 9, partial [Pan troglodytes]